MKRFKIFIALTMALALLLPSVAMAEETPVEEPPATEPVVEDPLPEDPSEGEEEPWIFEDILGDITEDSPLYQVKQLFEGITIEVTTDDSGVMSLTVSFENQMIFENELITAELLESLQASIAEKIQEYLNPEEDDTTEEEVVPEPETEEVPGAEPENPEEPEDPVSEPEEEPVDETPAAISFTIVLGENLTEEQLANILQIVVDEISGLVIPDTFTVAKDAFFTAKEQLIAAMNAWKEARKNGTDEEETAAYDALMAAREYKEEMEALKDAVEAIKDSIETEDESDGPPWEENPSIQNKLESNGIGKGLVKEKPEKPEKKEKSESPGKSGK